MIFFLLNIYLLLVWLIFIRLKLAPFNLAAKIGVAVVGVVGCLGILIAVNFLHPQSMDARVYETIIPIATRTSQPARVTRVNIEPNTQIHVGDVLFEVDSRPYKAEVARLEAALAAAEQNVPQLKASLEAAQASVAKVQGQLTLAETDESRYKKLAETRSVSQEEYDEKVRNLQIARSTFDEASAQATKAKLAYEANTASGENVDVAQTNAALTKAKLDLEETVVHAPADGYVTNLQLRTGMVVSPGSSVMNLIEDSEGYIVVTLPQEYLGNIAAGNEVEICLDMYPGKTLHGTVDTIILASGAGQLQATGDLPTATTAQTAARFPIKVRLNEEDAKRYRLPSGAHGAAAIYTDHVASLKIVRRVTLRWYTWLNYLKLSM